MKNDGKRYGVGIEGESVCDRLSEQKEGKRDLFFLSATQELERGDRVSLLSFRFPLSRTRNAAGLSSPLLVREGKGVGLPLPSLLQAK